jgi:hypothetical protein
MTSTTKDESRPMSLPHCWSERLNAGASIASRRTMFEIKRRILKKLSNRLKRGPHGFS